MTISGPSWALWACTAAGYERSQPLSRSIRAETFDRGGKKCPARALSGLLPPNLLIA